MASRDDFSRVFRRLNLNGIGWLERHPYSRWDNYLPNACADSYLGVICVTCPMVELCSNDDEIAGLLGHELGHIHMKHYLDRDTKDYYTREVEANIYAHFLMKELGYDLVKAYELYMKLRCFAGVQEAMAPKNLTIDEVYTNIVCGRSLKNENITKNVIAKCNFDQRSTSNEMWYAVNQRG